MKEKLIQIKNSLNRSNNSKYGFLLSVVALIEILMIILVSTFSWVETISSIKISNDGVTAAIDTYTYTDASVGIGSGYNQKIDLSKYFRESGNAHLSAASSADGVNFFFPKVAAFGSAAKAYRKGTINDKNTNYISFSFRVTAEGNNQKFFFADTPQFMADGEPITDTNDIRVAITVEDSEASENTTKIYSYDARSTQVVADVNGQFTTSSTIYAFGDYIDNTTEDPDKMLFSVDKNKTKIVTVTMWLQDFENTDDRDAYSGKVITANDFEIVTATKMTHIDFVDKTSGFNSTTAPVKNTWQWVSNDNAKMWVRTAAGENFEMTKSTDSSGSAPKWTVSIPTEQMGSNNSDMYFYRTLSSVTSNPQNNKLNYWKTKFADKQGANPVYTAYGASQASDGLVYGTWGKLSEIQLSSEDKKVLPTPTSATALNITQVTLKNSSNISVEMNYNNGFWRAYIPNDNASKNLRFSFGSYNISASNRDITEDVSTYYITSSNTGYWNPPSEVKVFVYEPQSDRGSVKVSGGAEGADWVKVTKGTSVTVTATANDDYSFEGWYTDPECTKLANQGAKSSFTFTADSEIYNYYAKFQYNVRLTAVTDNESDTNHNCKVKINNGTAGTAVNAPVKDGSKVTLTAIPNEENYVFDGWYYKNNEPVKDDSDVHIKDKVITIESLDKPIDYYAHFKVKYFTLVAYASTDGNARDDTGGKVKFDSSSVYSDYATASVKYTDKAYFMANANSAQGYEFKGWYSDAACTDRVCCQAEGTCDHTSFEADKNSEHKTLYAKFELKKYEVRAVATVGASTTASASGGTVELSANGTSSGTGSDKKLEVTHGHTVKFKATAKTADGYKFIGWFDKNGNSVNSNAEFTTANGVSGPITYYARFSKGTTIYFSDCFVEDDSYNAYAAYVYNDSNDTIKYAGNWPGTKISPDSDAKITTDEVTGYCVYTFDSNDSGNFRVIINNNGGSQYPGQNVAGRKGVLGNTYFFDNKSVGDMQSFTPISVGVNAVAYDENGTKQSNGFSGGSIKVGFNEYKTAKTLQRQSGDNFYATPQPAEGYKFDGWYTNASCTTKVNASAVTNNKLKIVPTNGTTYYAKFVKSASNKLYLKVSHSDWKQNNERFAAYFYNGDGTNGENTWVSMTSIGNDYYEVTIPDGGWKNIIFCRMNGTTTINNWDNKWNQTVDLNIPTNGNNCFTVSTKSNDKYNGTWSKY